MMKALLCRNWKRARFREACEASVDIRARVAQLYGSCAIIE